MPKHKPDTLFCTNCGPMCVNVAVAKVRVDKTKGVMYQGNYQLCEGCLAEFRAWRKRNHDTTLSVTVTLLDPA